MNTVVRRTVAIFFCTVNQIRTPLLHCKNPISLASFLPWIMGHFVCHSFLFKLFSFPCLVDWAGGIWGSFGALQKPTISTAIWCIRNSGESPEFLWLPSTTIWWVENNLYSYEQCIIIYWQSTNKQLHRSWVLCSLYKVYLGYLLEIERSFWQDLMDFNVWPSIS